MSYYKGAMLANMSGNRKYTNQSMHCCPKKNGPKGTANAAAGNELYNAAWSAI